jgi:hypothetical protein
VWHETADHLTRFGSAAGLGFPTYVQNNTGVSIVRNTIVADFLRTDGEVLLFCDDDVVPNENFPRLVEHIAEGRADVCAGIAPIVQDGTVILPNVFVLVNGQYTLRVHDFWREGLHEVDAVGSGIMAIHRRVLEDRKMQTPFRALLKNDGTWEHGEDVEFCRRARLARFKVCADFDILNEHRITIHANGVAKAYWDTFASLGTSDERTP